MNLATVKHYVAYGAFKIIIGKNNWAQGLNHGEKTVEMTSESAQVWEQATRHCLLFNHD